MKPLAAVSEAGFLGLPNPGALPGRRYVTVTRAALGDLPDRRRRLARYFLSLPSNIDTYFKGRPLRRWQWRFNSFGAGFFSGNVVSLTFGTLAVNDVLAAFAAYVFYMVVARAYLKAPRGSFKLELLNWFKNGVLASAIADCIKLGG